ncbi:MAG: alpha/beta hydrolase [Muribaculaceae bacterium]|nr:alpha/beta hydrolase [Muribaculaceae bacterium]
MDKVFNNKGVSLSYRDSGDGSVVILMHGWGCTKDTVASIERIALENHRVINVDFPGFGQSTEPLTVWGVEEYTKLIEALCEYENITNPILIGHSFGGRVAILFSSRNKTSKMVLVDAAGVKPRRSLKYYWKVYSFKTMKWIMRLLLGKEKSRKRIEAARSKRGSADYQNSTPMMRSVLSKVVNEDLRHVMPMIEAPTLLIWGGKDTATPLRDAEKMSKLIKDSGLVNFPNAGHYSFLDEPARFSVVLRSFLS